MSDRTYGLLITTLGVLVLTPDGLLVRLISVGPWSIVFWRGILAALSLLVFMALRYRDRLGGVLTGIGRKGIGVALLFGGSTVCFIQALKAAPVANVLIVISTAPLFSALISWITLGERVPLRTWLAIFGAVMGMAVTVMDAVSLGAGRGEMFALWTAVSLGAEFTILRSAPRVDMTPAVGLGALLGAVLGAIQAPSLVLSSPDTYYMALLGLFVLPVSFALIVIGPRHITAAETSLIMLLETVLGPLWVWLVVGEAPTTNAMAGGALVITTLAVHTVVDARARAMVRTGHRRGQIVVCPAADRVRQE